MYPIGYNERYNPWQGLIPLLCYRYTENSKPRGTQMAKKSNRHKIGHVTVYQRGAWWWYNLQMRGEKRQQGALDTKFIDVALNKAKEINRLAEAGNWFGYQKKKPVSLSYLIDQFRANYRGWSATTHEQCKYMGPALLTEFGDVLIDTLTPRKVEGWLTLRLDSGKISKSTRNRYVSYIRRLFGQAVDWGYLDESPMTALKFLKEDQKIPEALTHQQVNALLAELPPRSQDIVIAAVDTGLRRGELYGLRWDDLDFKERMITVRKSKSGQFRVVPMTDRVCSIFQQLRQTNRQNETPSVFVIPQIDLRSGLRSAGHRAGIGHVHFHMFRHTCATWLLEANADIRDVQAWLGHTDIKMTARYAKVRPGRLAAIAQRLEMEAK